MGPNRKIQNAQSQNTQIAFRFIHLAHLLSIITSEETNKKGGFSPRKFY